LIAALPRTLTFLWLTTAGPGPEIGLADCIGAAAEVDFFADLTAGLLLGAAGFVASLPGAGAAGVGAGGWSSARPAGAARLKLTANIHQ